MIRVMRRVMSDEKSDDNSLIIWVMSDDRHLGEPDISDPVGEGGRFVDGSEVDSHQLHVTLAWKEDEEEKRKEEEDEEEEEKDEEEEGEEEEEVEEEEEKRDVRKEERGREEGGEEEGEEKEKGT